MQALQGLRHLEEPRALTSSRPGRALLCSPAFEPIPPALTTPRAHPTTHASIVPMGGRVGAAKFGGGLVQTKSRRNALLSVGP